jgi:hypothetical protein
MPTKPVLTPPPSAPSRTDSANFAPRADAFLGWFATAWENLVAVMTFVDDAATATATSATSGAASATTATTKATEASTSAATATTKANEASTSATGAAASATTATTKATEASTSAATATTKANEASTSATGAAASATTATTKATEASTSAATATTKANEASTSATGAAASATTATTKAIEASTSAATATTKANDAGIAATAAAAHKADAAALVAMIGAHGAAPAQALPLQVFYSAAPITVNGSKVKDLIQGFTVIGRVYHGELVTVGGAAGAIAYVITMSNTQIIVESGTVKIVGGGGNDSIYVAAGAAVDAVALGSGENDVYLTGNLSDYIQTIDDEACVYIFKRIINGALEKVFVTLSYNNNRLFFANGHVPFTLDNTALFNETGTNFFHITASMLLPGGTPAFPAGAACISGPVPNDWLWADGRSYLRADWPGLAAILTASPAYTGDGSTTFTTPAVDPQNKTLTPHSGVPGVYAFIKGF